MMDLLKKLGIKKEVRMTVRIPEACYICSNKESYFKYNLYDIEANDFLFTPKQLKDLIIMTEKNELIMECKKCSAERIKQKWTFKIKAWWISCSKCKRNQLTLIEGKCPVHDLESKQTLAQWLEAHTDE